MFCCRNEKFSLHISFRHHHLTHIFISTGIEEAKEKQSQWCYGGIVIHMLTELMKGGKFNWRDFPRKKKSFFFLFFKHAVHPSNRIVRDDGKKCDTHVNRVTSHSPLVCLLSAGGIINPSLHPRQATPQLMSEEKNDFFLCSRRKSIFGSNIWKWNEKKSRFFVCSFFRTLTQPKLSQLSCSRTNTLATGFLCVTWCELHYEAIQMQSAWPKVLLAAFLANLCITVER